MASNIISAATASRIRDACVGQGSADRYSIYSMDEWMSFLQSIGVAHDASCSNLVIVDTHKYTMACLRYGF